MVDETKNEETPDGMDSDGTTEEARLPATLAEENAVYRERLNELQKKYDTLQERHKALGESFSTQMKQAQDTIAQLQEHIKGITQGNPAGKPGE